MDFKIGGGLTTAVDLTSRKHLQRIAGNTRLYGAQESWEGVGETVTTSCYTLNSMLEALGTDRVDYFSLDVEGAELYVLQSIDWARVVIDVLTIEIGQSRRGDIHAFMLSKGYRRVEPAPLEIDDVYVRVASGL